MNIRPASGSNPDATLLAMEASPSGPDLARIDTRQIPISARNPRTVCGAVGIEWDKAQKLFRDGFLSFDPAKVPLLDESQDAELCFLGSLAALHCSSDCLRELLTGLKKPYSYDLRRVFFNWGERKWHLFPGEENPEGAFFDLLDRVGSRNERKVLLAIRGWLDEALEIADEREHFFSHADLRDPRS